MTEEQVEKVVSAKKYLDVINKTIDLLNNKKKNC